MKSKFSDIKITQDVLARAVEWMKRTERDWTPMQRERMKNLGTFDCTGSKVVKVSKYDGKTS